MDQAEEAHELIKKFPKSEMFGLSSQFQRAADSVSLNISEGSINQTNPEQRKFLSYAIRSIAECVTCIHKARRRKYITQEEFEKFYHEEEILMAKTLTFKRGVR